MTKHIFVTGGVVSSLGKGLNSASIGMLLESRGLKVRLQKFDPYVNVDPGTMSPYEHGEVYVTEDGAETDLDLGHYELFTNSVSNRYCNFTTGSIYHSVIMKERKGEYLGKTVQVIPHITNEIIECIQKLDGPDTDVVISEIGGIVGDIENQPFLEAIRQFGQKAGRENVLYIHLTLVPYLSAAEEIKTKPTQHSVGMMRQAGIQPDIIICRTEKHLGAEVKEKLSLFCNVDSNAIIEERDVKPYLYEIPLILVEQGLDKFIIQKLKLKTNGNNIDKWLSVLEILKNPKHATEIAIVGKYICHQSSYESIYSGRPRLERASRPQALRALAVHLIAGHGIAQMSEYMLSLNLTRTFNLLDIAFARAALAWRVARRTQLCRLMLGPDARANAGFLEYLLRSVIEKDSPAGEPLGT